MKQNPSEANLILVLLLFASLSVGCVQRPRDPLLQSSKIDTSIVDGGRININTAPAEDLEALPGIGRVIAERIVKHRLKHGPFRRAEHLMLVAGISERKFLEIAPLITVN